MREAAVCPVKLERTLRSRGRISNRIDGHNVVASKIRATIEQIDFARDNHHMTSREVTAHFDDPAITLGMVRHWRSGELPRAYLRAKGLVDA